jgi:hypothetical protein
MQRNPTRGELIMQARANVCSLNLSYRSFFFPFGQIFFNNLLRLLSRQGSLLARRCLGLYGVGIKMCHSKNHVFGVHTEGAGEGAGEAAAVGVAGGSLLSSALLAFRSSMRFWRSASHCANSSSSSFCRRSLQRPKKKGGQIPPRKSGKVDSLRIRRKKIVDCAMAKVNNWVPSEVNMVYQTPNVKNKMH